MVRFAGGWNGAPELEQPRKLGPPANGRLPLRDRSGDSSKNGLRYCAQNKRRSPSRSGIPERLPFEKCFTTAAPAAIPSNSARVCGDSVNCARCLHPLQQGDANEEMNGTGIGRNV